MWGLDGQARAEALGVKAAVVDGRGAGVVERAAARLLLSHGLREYIVSDRFQARFAPAVANRLLLSALHRSDSVAHTVKSARAAQTGTRQFGLLEGKEVSPL